MTYKDDAKASRRDKLSHYADGGLVDRNGRSISDGDAFDAPATFKTKSGWDKEESDKRQSAADRAAAGTSNRSIGEHLLAGARAVWEGDKFRDAVSKGRDPINPLYDKRSGKP